MVLVITEFFIPQLGAVDLWQPPDLTFQGNPSRHRHSSQHQRSAVSRHRSAIGSIGRHPWPARRHRSHRWPSVRHRSHRSPGGAAVQSLVSSSEANRRPIPEDDSAQSDRWSASKQRQRQAGICVTSPRQMTRQNTTWEHPIGMCPR